MLHEIDIGCANLIGSCRFLQSTFRLVGCVAEGRRNGKWAWRVH